MSKKAKQDETAPEIVEEKTEAEAPAETAETAADTTAVTETAEAVEEKTEAAEETTTETAEDPSEDTDTPEAEICCSEKPLRFVSKIVRKIKEKRNPSIRITVEGTAGDEFTEEFPDKDPDEIILDDDIIAELQEYERREKMKKKAMLCAAGALAVGVIIGIAIKSRKKD